VNKHIGAVLVSSLTPAVVAKMVAQMTSDGRSPRSRQAAVGTLKSAVAWAATAKLILANPIADFKRSWPRGTSTFAWRRWTRRRELIQLH
jgi:site-specific recombinase XerC